MLLRPLLRRLSNRVRRDPSDPLDYFLPVEDFQHQVTCERMRVDRNGSTVALLTISLPFDRRTTADYRFLATTVQRRVRITDTAGYLSDGRIGVLLPDTDVSGAWKVASDLCDRYEVGHNRPDCEVSIYPDQTGGTHEPLAVPGESRDASVPGSEVRIDAFEGLHSPWWKRILDVVGATIGLVLSAPLIFVAGVVIRLTSPGPIFYLQEREGLGGKPFKIIKLRTMRDGADRYQMALRPFSEQDGPAFKMTNDPRITPVGRWLRWLSLDELPQFWNVLRGDMSLVGPRPLPVHESLCCHPWQRRRLMVKPGMTGVWQIRGRNTVSFNEWVRMDIEYIRRRSLWYDLRLLAETVPALVRSRGPR